MTGKRKTGDIGEEIAADYLSKKGFTVLRRNYTVRGGEIDIIARKGAFLVFIEVKLRKNNRFEAPRAAITDAKKKHLLTAAERYLYEMRTDAALSALQPRFDCIEIILHDLTKKDRAIINHIVNIEMY